MKSYFASACIQVAVEIVAFKLIPLVPGGIGSLRKKCSQLPGIIKKKIRHGQTAKRFLRQRFKPLSARRNELLEETPTYASTQKSEAVEETPRMEKATAKRANASQKVKIDIHIHVSRKRKKHYSCKLTLPSQYKNISKANMECLNEDASNESLDKVGPLNPTDDELLAPHLPRDHCIDSSNLLKTHTETSTSKGKKVYNTKFQRKKFSHLTKSKHVHICIRFGKDKELTAKLPYPGTAIPVSSPFLEKKKGIWCEISKRPDMLEERHHQVIGHLDAQDKFSVKRQDHLPPELPEAKRQKVQHSSVATSSQDPIAHIPPSIPTMDATTQSPTIFCSSFLL